MFGLKILRVLTHLAGSIWQCVRWRYGINWQLGWIRLVRWVFLPTGVPMSIQRLALTLKNGLFLRFHRVSPGAGCFSWRRSLPETWPRLRCNFFDLLWTVGLPETSAISPIGASALPFNGALNVQINLVHNGHEVFGCCCSLFCQMFEVSPRYSVKSLSYDKGVDCFCPVNIYSRKNMEVFSQWSGWKKMSVTGISRYEVRFSIVLTTQTKFRNHQIKKIHQWGI